MTRNADNEDGITAICTVARAMSQVVQKVRSTPFATEFVLADGKSVSVMRSVVEEKPDEALGVFVRRLVKLRQHSEAQLAADPAGIVG